MLGTEEVRVVRDSKTGAIVSVPDGRKEREGRNPLIDPLNDLSDSEAEDGEEEREDIGRSRGIVPDLEEAAKYSKKKRPPRQSQREREWIERLVDKWGDNWGGMVRDRRLNPQQQTEGDLRRRVGLWNKDQARNDVREDGDGMET